MPLRRAAKMCGSHNKYSNIKLLIEKFLFRSGLERSLQYLLA